MNIPELVLYEDNHLLVLGKPGGILVQGDRTGDETLLQAAKAYLKEKYRKPGNVFLAPVHRLDRVTSGVVVLARTSKAARRLSAAFRERGVKKYYLAVVHGKVRPKEGRLEDRLRWDERRRRALPDPQGQSTRLRYRVLKQTKKSSLLFLQPETGRHHQIRVQWALRGHPIKGDLKYGSREKVFFGRAILLHAVGLALPHPTRKEEIFFKAPLPPYWPEAFRVDLVEIDSEAEKGFS